MNKKMSNMRRGFGLPIRRNDIMDIMFYFVKDSMTIMKMIMMSLIVYRILKAKP